VKPEPTGGVFADPVDEGILDTTFFVDALRGDAGARGLVDRIVDNSFHGYCSPITVVELSVSPRFTPMEDSFFHGLFSRMTEVPFDTRAARLTGLYLRPLPRDRAERLFRDAMIGCTATVSGLTCYTRNVRDISVFAASVRRY
jgi:predicted nucleic acid-binding protein